ncbi:hypothetical protein BpHYR1_021438 [Brachionus plicatilis]|uniref:Uncharacterized protein n=1 Tax=Brachionus plicatilis TaxID=10195 RepID=A0A3M7Q905_BRAPC|nr:hypothetical protein BpHYR1_021438 [Brachionus plicatilis]
MDLLQLDGSLNKKTNLGFFLKTNEIDECRLVEHNDNLLAVYNVAFLGISKFVSADTFYRAIFRLIFAEVRKNSSELKKISFSFLISWHIELLAIKK